MDEGTSKAIPLRRSRSARAVAARSNDVAAASTAGWTAGLADGLLRAVGPTRQLWLAGLGGTTLTLRGVREVWALLVSEGAATELAIRRALQRG
jgi:hypothetical protein